MDIWVLCCAIKNIGFFWGAVQQNMVEKQNFLTEKILVRISGISARYNEINRKAVSQNYKVNK